MNEEILGKLTNSIITGDPDSTLQLTEQALASGIEPLDIINQGLIPGMDVVGEKFSTSQFIEKIKETQADISGLSALLTTTMIAQRQIIQALSEAGIRDHAKVMISGAPVTESWSQEIGADGYAEDAMGAFKLAKQLMDS